MSDDELPCLVYTSRGYMVSGPDEDGEIDVEDIGDYHKAYMFFDADDLRMMLDRIERGKK